MKIYCLFFSFILPLLLFSQEDSLKVIVPDKSDQIPKRHLADADFTYLGFALNFAKPVSPKLSLGLGVGGIYYFGISLTPNHFAEWNQTDFEHRYVADLLRGRLFLRHYTLSRLVLEGGLKYTYTMFGFEDYCEPCSDQTYGAEIVIIYGKRAVKLKSSFSFMISNYNTSFFIIWNPIVININLN